MSDQLAATTRMSNLPPVPPNWLWEGRLARGKIVLLAGPSGSGKTFLALDFAARVTTGRPYPETSENGKLNTENTSEAGLSENRILNTENAGEAGHVVSSDRCGEKNSDNREPTTDNKRGSVLLVTPQEDLLDNIRPRLQAAQADPDKITATSELNLDRIRDLMDRIDDLQLVIVDPLSYLVTNDNETLSPIKKLFEIYQHGYARYITVLAITSMRPGRGDPIHRISGIAEISPFASLIYAVSPDYREENTDPQRRVLVQLKNNLSPILPPLAFNIKNSAVDWSTDNLPIENPEAALSRPHAAPGPDPVLFDRCVKWLYEFLEPNPRPQQEVLDAAIAAGFSYMTLRAKDELEVQSKRDKSGKWIWRVWPGKLDYDNFDQWTDRVLRFRLPGLDEFLIPPAPAPSVTVPSCDQEVKEKK